MRRLCTGAARARNQAAYALRTARCRTIALRIRPAWNRDCYLMRLLTDNDDPTDAPAAARSREHPHPARGRRRVRTAGDAVLDRQGQLGDAAPGDEGVLSRRKPPFPLLHVDTTWKFREMIAFRDRDRRAARPGAARAHQPGRPRARHRPVHARLGRAHRRDEDAGAEAGARQVRLRRRVRRRAPRRREVARQGARVLVPLRAASLGSEAPAARALAPVQRAQAQGREPARVPAVELDRARHLAVHLPGEHSDRAAVLRRSSGRSSSATAR